MNLDPIKSEPEPPGLRKTISLLQLLPQTSRNRYFYENGLAKFIPRLTLKVHSDLEECFLLWEKFSPKKSLFDLWDFRYAWYLGYKHKPYFYTVYEGKKPVALLPLCWSYDEKNRRRFEWFGTDWMEDNSFFAQDPHLIDFLYAVVPSPVHLNTIQDANELKGKLIYSHLKKDDPKYEKVISSFTTIEDFLQTLDKKHRYNLRADSHRIQSMNPRVVITESKDLDLLNKLISMNIQQFQGKSPKDDSDLMIPKRAETYRNIVKTSGIYTIKFIQVFIQNYLAAIDLIIQFKDRYYPIKSANDLNRFKGIGNFMLYLEFQDAIENKFSLVDCLQYDYGWKHRYFEEKPLFVFEK